MRAAEFFISSIDLDPAIGEWLEAFSQAVRDKDYARGRMLFAPDINAFGTRRAIIHGIDQLVADQWQPIWEATRGFAFELSQVHGGLDGFSAWVAVPWQSQGYSLSVGWFGRRGRATYVLQFREGRWLAIHSHHSLDPIRPLPVGERS